MVLAKEQVNWNAIHSGQLERDEIMNAVKDEDWQKFRKSLKGLTTDEKLWRLREWLRSHTWNRKSQVQVTNYLNALKRGGLIA